MYILVSACLLGMPCRYDGTGKREAGLEKLREQGHTLIPVCPEVLGGLPIPRPPAERQPDGRVITGKTSALLGASSAAMLNALKAVAGIDDSVHLIAPEVIEPIQHLKVEHLGNHNPRLHTDETLIALSISAVTDPNAERAMEHLAELAGCDAHSTVILSQVDTDVFRKLGVNMSCEPTYQTKKLYHKR